MTSPVTTDWMTIQDLMKETGMCRASAYSAASSGKLPVPVYRFGGRYMISRQAWEALKTQGLPSPQSATRQKESVDANA